MNILLDECTPWPLHKLLPEHVCDTPSKRGWGGMKNGELPRRAEENFELFITCDQKMRYQQDIRSRKIAILELSANKWRAIKKAGDEVRANVVTMKPCEYRQLIIPQ